MIRIHGKSASNKILIDVANILKQLYPNAMLSHESDTSEFTFITTGIAENIAIEAKNISNHLQKDFHDIGLELFFGIYQLSSKLEPLSLSLSKCLLAYRSAIDRPAERIIIYDSSLEQMELNNQYLINNFRSSIENGNFKLFIQPKYNLEQSYYYGGEALVRWELNGKLIPPLDFIPLFESNGLCKTLDLYILDLVCQEIKKGLLENPNNVVPISVNFSRTDFIDLSLFDEMMFITNKYEVPTKFIEIEITESAFSQYEEQLSLFIKKCHHFGIKILMDDFGSGLSSFNSLKNIDIDVLKLDYKFLSKEGDQGKGRKIIESIIALARAINVSVVIEGVETNSEASFFRKLGVRHIQGYLFGKPIPANEFAKINNKNAEFYINDTSDARLFLQDALDHNSNVSLLIENAQNPVGIFRLENDALYPEYINRYSINFLSKVSCINDFYKTSLLSFFKMEDGEKLLKALNNNNNVQYEFSPRTNFTMKFGFDKYEINGCYMLIKTVGKVKYFLLDAVKANTLINTSNLSSTTFEELDWLLEGHISGYVIYDNNFIIYGYNAIAKKIYPNLEKGKSILVLDKKELLENYSTYRLYSDDLKTVYEINIRHFNNNGKLYIALKLSDLGSPNTHISQLDGYGYKYHDRLLSSLESLSLTYVEIDLTTDTYLCSNFAKNEDIDKSSLGKYKEGFLKDLFLKYQKMIELR